MRIGSICPVLVLLLVATPLAGQDTLDADWQRESALLVAPLHELAQWARAQKLFGSCIRTHQTIIRLSPDDPEARRVLRFRRDKTTGAWTRARKFRVPKNLKPEHEPEFQQRRQRLIVPFVSAILESLDRNGDAIDGNRRTRFLRDLLLIAPDSVKVRKALGQTRSGDGWISEDAVVASARRKALVGEAREIVGKVPSPMSETLDASEKGLRAQTPVRVRTQRVRVIGNVSREEGLRAALACDAAPRVYNHLLGRRATLPREFTVYMFSKEQDKLTFLEDHPQVPPDSRKYLAQLGGGWLKGSKRLGVWAPNAEGRIDFAVRQGFALCLMNDLGLSMRQGWAWEGLGLYLTDLVCQTKLTYFVRRTGYGDSRDALRERLLKKETNWFHEALLLLKRAERPTLQHVLNSDATSMNDEDMLYAYVIAAWLIETRGSKLVPILKAAAKKGADGHLAAGFDVLRTQLGMAPADIETRILAWLEALAQKSGK